jgi:hypothetical protein
MSPLMRACPRRIGHDDFDDTFFGLDGVTTFTVGGARTDLNPGEAPSWPDSAPPA